MIKRHSYASSTTAHFAKVFGPAFLATVAFAQPQPVSQPTGAPQQSPGFLRAWVIPEAGAGRTELRLPPASPEARPLILASSGSGEGVIPTTYTTIPAGTASLELLSDGKAVSSKTVQVRPATYATVLATQKGSGWELRVFEDGPAKKTAATRTVRVLNFAKGLPARFTVGTNKPSPVAADSWQELQLPRAQLGVSVAMLSTNGGPPSSTPAAIDLVASDSAYVVVLPDHRGRMRPQVIPGAPAPVAEAPKPRTADVRPLTPAQVREQQLTSIKLDLEHNKSILAMIEASEKGPNKMPNADLMRKEAENAIAKLSSKIKAIQAAAEAAPVPANSDQRPPN